MKILIFTTLLLFFGCTPNSDELIILEGNIDSKVNGRLELTRTGDRIMGTFENADDRTQLELRGSIQGEYLRLEEFAEKDKLTGIFDGKYDGEQHIGEWISPNRKRKAPFSFSIQALSHPSGQPKADEGRDAPAAIVAEYSKWAKRMNQTEYCTPAKCQAALENGRKGVHSDDDCALSLEEAVDPKSIIFGDINADDVVDGIITARLEACMDGTWSTLALMSGHLVIFISDGQGGYDVVDEPSVIRDEIGNGHVVSIADGVIHADGAENSGEAVYWEMDITWKSQFKYVNGKFELISSTEHVQSREGE